MMGRRGVHGVKRKLNRKIIFVFCPIAWAVWSNVHRWFGVTSVVPSKCPYFVKASSRCIGLEKMDTRKYLWFDMQWFGHYGELEMTRFLMIKR
jgi:hypothetical protein